MPRSEPMQDMVLSPQFTLQSVPRPATGAAVLEGHKRKLSESEMDPRPSKLPRNSPPLQISAAAAITALTESPDPIPTSVAEPEIMIPTALLNLSRDLIASPTVIVVILDEFAPNGPGIALATELLQLKQNCLVASCAIKSPLTTTSLSEALLPLIGFAVDNPAVQLVLCIPWTLPLVTPVERQAALVLDFIQNISIVAAAGESLPPCDVFPLCLKTVNRVYSPAESQLLRIAKEACRIVDLGGKWQQPVVARRTNSVGAPHGEKPARGRPPSRSSVAPAPMSPPFSPPFSPPTTFSPPYVQPTLDIAEQPRLLALTRTVVAQPPPSDALNDLAAAAQAMAEPSPLDLLSAAAAPDVAPPVLPKVEDEKLAVNELQAAALIAQNSATRDCELLLDTGAPSSSHDQDEEEEEDEPSEGDPAPSPKKGLRFKKRRPSTQPRFDPARLVGRGWRARKDCRVEDHQRLIGHPVYEALLYKFAQAVYCKPPNMHQLMLSEGYYFYRRHGVAFVKYATVIMGQASLRTSVEYIKTKVKADPAIGQAFMRFLADLEAAEAAAAKSA
eukprot:TRINITY_DN1317_c0_g1_i1.p1 TRINITY_DN1317_c0_g1~~TRINITY_DN1317_c0_g1_i1.p1  ORF type:complete len:559 (+),score=101.52 TRINITY_DN1317_c0_g1_i1:176-1852(+)